MNVYTNVDVLPETVTRLFGTRTLVLANNTHKEGYFFKDVFLWVERKGPTSIISINENKGPKSDEVLGVYFGTNIEVKHGVKFEGRSTRLGVEYTILLAKPGAEIIEDGELWFLDENVGWVSLGIQEDCILEHERENKFPWTA